MALIDHPLPGLQGVSDGPDAVGPGPRAKGRRINAEKFAPYLFVAPGLLLFVGLVVYPVIQAFRISLYDWQVMAGVTSDFVGTANYSRAIEDPRFWSGLANSGVYMALTVPPQIVIGLFIASMLKRRSPTQPVYRVLYYLPVVTSWVVVSLLFKYLFADDGLVNFGLKDVLRAGSGVSWFSGRWTAMVAICALGVWKGVGWSMMIFLAALQGVDQALEEAATVDGANRWHRFRAVTLPAIWPSVIFVTVMLVIGGFNVFTSVLVMTGGGPGGQTDVLLTYMYRQAFDSLEFGYGSSIAVLLTALVFVISLAQMRLLGRGRSEA